MTCKSGRIFFLKPGVFARPFIDFTETLTAQVISMFSDVAKNPELGFGAICGNQWMYSPWEPSFIIEEDLSIEFLELFGVLAAVLAWIHQFRNKRIILFCNNQSVVSMINSTSSKCARCMVLIRLLVLKSLTENVRVFARHITGKLNDFSDSLSRLDIERFYKPSTTGNLQTCQHTYLMRFGQLVKCGKCKSHYLINQCQYFSLQNARGKRGQITMKYRTVPPFQ